jgi:hypothetical protein
VRIALSHPLTGSGGRSLDFPANKIVDRLVNAKRGSKQTTDNLPAVLYIDVRHDWALSATDTLPLRTVYSKGVHWIGTLGAWHAFYGQECRRSMLRDRVSLPFLNFADVHEQARPGLFRVAPHWSAVLLAVRDGAVVFENPWTTCPVAEPSFRKLLRLHRVRPDYSWFRGGATPAELGSSIELTLSRMQWLFETEADAEDVEREAT